MTARESLPVTVGRRLTLIREARGLTQQALAESLGWAPVRIWRFERGVAVTLKNMETIATALRIPIAQLLPINITKIARTP